MEKPKLNTKIGIVLEKGLPTWKALNVSAFLASAIASKFPETLGKDFVDASSISYLGIFRQPVLIFEARSTDLRKAYTKARDLSLSIGIYTRPIFETQGDQNLVAVSELTEDNQDLVGIIVYGDIEKVNTALKGLSLHK